GDEKKWKPAGSGGRRGIAQCTRIRGEIRSRRGTKAEAAFRLPSFPGAGEDRQITGLGSGRVLCIAGRPCLGTRAEQFVGRRRRRQQDLQTRPLRIEADQTARNESLSAAP